MWPGPLCPVAAVRVRELAEEEGVEEVLSPGQQLRRHPVGKLVVEQDHLVRPRGEGEGRGGEGRGGEGAYHGGRGRGEAGELETSGR